MVNNNINDQIHDLLYITWIRLRISSLHSQASSNMLIISFLTILTVAQKTIYIYNKSMWKSLELTHCYWVSHWNTETQPVKCNQLTTESWALPLYQCQHIGFDYWPDQDDYFLFDISYKVSSHSSPFQRLKECNPGIIWPFCKSLHSFKVGTVLLPRASAIDWPVFKHSQVATYHCINIMSCKQQQFYWFHVETIRDWVMRKVTAMDNKTIIKTTKQRNVSSASHYPPPFLFLFFSLTKSRSRGKRKSVSLITTHRDR